MVRKLKTALYITLVALGGCADKAPPTLTTTESRQCVAEGGYESRAPFGTPICQMRYIDAGKSCAGKADCLGRCLSDAPDNAAAIPVGALVVGRCEAEKQTFGCYASVEGGKLAEPYICFD